MAERTNQPNLELGTIIEGIEESLSLCEAAMVLAAGDRAGKNSGPDRFSVIARRYVALDTCRLFDPEHPDYPTRSIPAALNYLRFHADYLRIEKREVILQRLVRFGHETREFEGIPDPWITQLLRKEFADRLPRASDPNASELSGALHTLRSLCDRFPLDPPDRPAMERAIEALLAYAKDFVQTVRQGYL